jgi:hypothetical protein
MPTLRPSGRRGCSKALVFCLFLIISLGAGIHAHSQTDISTSAYELISQRASADQGSFYVYLDQDSGFNHGFPSGYMGTDQGTISLNTGCIDDPGSTTGCSTDPTALDRVHGTVLNVSFAAQTPGNWASLALEEPLGWLDSQSGNGYDLTGATSVSFNVKSPNGAQVEFGVGNCTTPFTQPISSTWTTVTLALNSTALSCTPDLTNVHLLFEIVTNDVHDPTEATVLLDNIQFFPVPTVQQSALSFPLANQTFGVVPQQNSPIPPDQSLRNVTTIYESALAEYVLLSRGTTQDLQNAKLIADTFDYALQHDSHGDPIPVATGGYVGLHNGYESGDIALFNNQSSLSAGQAGDIRLAGFTDSTLCAPSGYCLMLDGATGGNNAFAILALVDAYEQFNDVRYLNDALTIGNWIVGNLTDTTTGSNAGYGGYFSGYNDGGIPPPKPLLTGKSIENNADIFAAFTALATIESRLGNSSAAASWTTAANIAGDFVMQMYDPINGRFNVGTSPVGSSASPGTCPTGPKKGSEVINVCDFLDSNTFTTLAMANAPRYQHQIDWQQPIQYALNQFAQTVTAAGLTYQGFDIVPTPVSGANGVAWEFTGQVVEAMNYVDKLYNVTTFESSANTYLDQIAQAQTSAPFGDGLGLVASTLQSGNSLTPVNQCLNTPYQCIAERVGLAATAWGILAEQKLNVYNLNGEEQTINFPTIPAQTVGTPLTLSATASSNLVVSFTSATQTICTVSGATATFIASGTCTIDATQAGNSTYAAATMVPQSFTVNGEAQTITFGTIAAQTVGTPLTLSATASSGLTVSFASTTTSVCTVSGATATFIAAGSCTIDANQAGNNTYAAATMVPQTFTVNLPATPTFTIAGIAVSVTSGATTGNTSTITVTPAGGFTGTVNLSCAISPMAASKPVTCSLSPASVAISGAAQTSTLTVSTTAATTCSSALVHPKLPGEPWYAAGGATLACLLLFGIPARRRSWRTMLGMLALLAALSGGVLACGGGGGGSGNNCTSSSGTTAGTYTITVTGTSGTITATSTITLTVQ